VTVLAAGQPVVDIIHYHYVRDGRHLVLLANTSRECGYDFTLGLSCTGEVEIWDAETGTGSPCLVAREHAEGLELPLSLPPVGSVLVVVDPAPSCPRTPVVASDLPLERLERGRAVALTAASGTYRVTVGSPAGELRQVAATVRNLPPVVELGGEWEFATLRPNALPLTGWQLALESRRNGLHYTTSFQAEVVPAEARLVLDGLAGEKAWERSAQVPYEVQLNGEKLAFAPGDYLDHCMYEADLAGLLREGANRVEILTQGNLYEAAALRHPPLLVGRFAVAPGARLRLVGEPGTLSGPWDEAGYPYYSGLGSYCRRFALTVAQAQSRLFLEMEAPGDLVEVLVNGKSCGVRAWEPWRVEVTAAACRGENELELRIANSLQNLLVQEPKPSGLLGAVRLVPSREVEFNLG